MTLGVEQRLQSGDWIDYLPSDPGLTRWQVSFRKCELFPDGTLQVSSNEAGHMLYSRMLLGTEFKVLGQYEVMSSTSAAFQGGLVMGLPQFENYNWYAFRMKRNNHEGDVVTFTEHWSRRQLLAPLPLDKKPIPLLFFFRADVLRRRSTAENSFMK